MPSNNEWEFHFKIDMPKATIAEILALKKRLNNDISRLKKELARQRYNFHDTKQINILQEILDQLEPQLNDAIEAKRSDDELNGVVKT